MRIESNPRTASSGARAPARNTAPGQPFHVDDSGQTPRAAAPAGAAPATALDALLALQAVDDPVLKRRKLVRRGQSLLDALEAIKADLLVGRVSEGRLNQLMAVIGQARERGDPGLDALLEDIELRARVELAKRGLFPKL